MFEAIQALLPVILGGIASGFLMIQVLSFIEHNNQGKGGPISAFMLIACAVAPVSIGLLYYFDLSLVIGDAAMSRMLLIVVMVGSVFGGFVLPDTLYALLLLARKNLAERQTRNQVHN